MPLRDIWQGPETLLVGTAEGGVTSCGQGTGVLLTILQRAGQLPTARNHMAPDGNNAELEKL